MKNYTVIEMANTFIFFLFFIFFCEIILKNWFKISCAKLKSGHFDSQDI